MTTSTCVFNGNAISDPDHLSTCGFGAGADYMHPTSSTLVFPMKMPLAGVDNLNARVFSENATNGSDNLNTCGFGVGANCISHKINTCAPNDHDIRCL